MPPVNIDHSDLIWGIVGPGMFFVLVSYMLGLVVFAPLHTRAAWPKQNTRFRIADIIILVVQLQVVAGALFALRPLIDSLHTAWGVTLVLLAWLLIGFWWWTGVRMLANTRVERATDRLLFLSLMLPLGYVSTLGVLLMPVLAIFSIGAAYWVVTTASWRDGLTLFLLIDAIAVIFACALLVRSYSRRIADRARDDVARDDGIDFDKMNVQHQAKPGSFPPMATDREVRILDETPVNDDT